MTGEKRERLAQAYAGLLSAGYQPGSTEAQYISRFLAEEDKGEYHAGCTDFRSLRAAIWTLEALRLMNTGNFGADVVPKLLHMALSEYKREMKGVRGGW